MRPPLAITLLRVDVRQMPGGAIETVRLAGGGVMGFGQFGSRDWHAGLGRAPAIVERLGFDGDGFAAGSVVSATSIEWRGGLGVTDYLTERYWQDAPFLLHVGPDGGADGDMTLRLAGRVTDIQAGRGIITIGLADRSVDYAKPVITASFAGTGGIEGDAELTGRAKRRGWGRLFNVELISLLKANNIHCVSDPSRPILAFDQVYDRGNAASALTVIGWAGSIAATLAALIASVPPAGGASVAPSIACIKWWHGNPGKLTADIRGEIGAGYVDRPVDIAIAILGAIAAPTTDAANVAAHRAVRNHECGWLISDSGATAAGEVQSLMSGISSWYSFDPDGVIRFGTYGWGASVATLSAAVTEVTRSFKPVSKVMIGWRTNNTVMARGDIAEAVFAADVSGLGALATRNTVVAAEVTDLGALGTKNTADFATDVTGTDKPEPNADVTMLVNAPPVRTIPYDFDGTPKTGMFPAYLNFKLLRGASSDVTTLATWTATLKSGTAAFTIGAATGILEVTSCSVDATFEASAVYLGVTRKAQSGIVRKLDDPPVITGGGGGGGGSGGTSDSTASISATTSNSYGSPNSRDLIINAGATGVVNLSFPGEFTRATNGTAGAFGKWQWRVPAGVWADVSTEIASSSSASRAGAPEPDNTAGSIIVNQSKSGLTAGSPYEFRLLLRGSVATTLNWVGTASGAGA